MSFKTETKDHGAKMIRERVMELAKSRPYVAVGVISDEEARGAEDGLSIAALATFHEFGTETIPQRSFLRGTVKENKSELLEATANIYQKVIHGKMSTKHGLSVIGELFVALVKKRIVAGIDPELKPATIKAKGSSTPLIDTGQLLNSITYQVRGTED